MSPLGAARPQPPLQPDNPHDWSEAKQADVSGFGLKLFLAGLSFLFAATIVGYVVVMLGGSDTEWSTGATPTYEEAVRGVPPGAPEIAAAGSGMLRQPAAVEAVPTLSGSVWLGLAGATLLMLASSVTIGAAYRALRRGQDRRFERFLISTLALGAVFLIAQVVNWLQLAAELPLEEGGLRSATFYLMTGTHALHVVGGLVPLGIVVHRASAGRYSNERWVGVRNVAWYWHFLDVVWVLMLVAMWAVGH